MIVDPTGLITIPFKVSLEQLEDVEHVDFFRITDDFILPPPILPGSNCSDDINGGECAVPIIWPVLLMILQGVAERLIGANKVAGVDSALSGNDDEERLLLLFSIFMLKHCEGANTWEGEGRVVAEKVEGTCIETW